MPWENARFNHDWYSESPHINHNQATRKKSVRTDESQLVDRSYVIKKRKSNVGGPTLELHIIVYSRSLLDVIPRTVASSEFNLLFINY